MATRCLSIPRPGSPERSAWAGRCTKPCRRPGSSSTRRPRSSATLIDVCRNGPAEKLNSTVVSQPAIFVGSLAALESLRASDPEAESACVAAAGLSLGEYTALVFAGAHDLRGRLAPGAAARRGDAGGRRRHAQRHGQHPGPRGGAGRQICADARQHRHASRSPTCSVPGTSWCRATRPPATRSRSWPSNDRR